MILNQYEGLKEIFQEMEKDVIKFDAGNNAAGTRARKKAQEVKNGLGEIRKNIQEIKNERTAK